MRTIPVSLLLSWAAIVASMVTCVVALTIHRDRLGATAFSIGVVMACALTIYMKLEAIGQRQARIELAIGSLHAVHHEHGEHLRRLVELELRQYQAFSTIVRVHDESGDQDTGPQELGIRRVK